MSTKPPGVELQPRVTGMAHAFVDALTEKAPVRWAKTISRVCARNKRAGVVLDRPINVKVSFRTAQKLKQEGVLE